MILVILLVVLLVVIGFFTGATGRIFGPLSDLVSGTAEDIPCFTEDECACLTAVCADPDTGCAAKCVNGKWIVQAECSAGQTCDLDACTCITPPASS